MREIHTLPRPVKLVIEYKVSKFSTVIVSSENKTGRFQSNWSVDFIFLIKLGAEDDLPRVCVGSSKFLKEILF